MVFVTQDSNIRPISGARVVLGAWRSINLRARHLLARIRKDRCYDCLRPIRWWNRRVWLADGERWVHLQCWRDELFFKALVADQIRRAKVTADENSELSRNRSAENERQEPPAYAAQPEKVEQLVILLQPAEELAARTRVNENRSNGNSSLRGLGQDLWHFLGRLAPHRPPRPPRFCMLCGAVEFSQTFAIVCHGVTYNFLEAAFSQKTLR
jgi:hypothetical protein